MKKFCIILLFVLCLGLTGIAQDRRLKILEQPKPELPQNYTTLDVQGTVILSVQFLEFGEIGEITTVKTLPSGLTEKAVAAARKIKFEPEMKDGKPVTAVKQVEYSYSWNGGWRSPTDMTTIAPPTVEPGKAEDIIKKAVQNLGGDRYLRVKTQIGRGKFSVIKEKTVVSFQEFVDVIVFPDKERTEFKVGGIKTVQTNTDNTGWVFDGEQNLIKVQNERQVSNFKNGIRTSLDNLLRGYWKNEAEISYAGKRQATLGKRNDVIKLTYKDGMVVEFEFAGDDGLPAKSIYKLPNPDGEELKEEDRYAQFVDVDGVKAAFIIDRFTNGAHSSRINYVSIEFNKSISDSVFAKPSDPKGLKKDLKP